MERPETLRQALQFDDIGLLPTDKSDIKSRKDVDVSTQLSRNIRIKYPIISSPMDTISDVEMCIVLNKMGAAGILHRFMSIEEQVEKAKKIKKETGVCYVAIGLKDYEERIIAFWNLAKENIFIDLFVLDSANGSSVLVEEFMNWFNKRKATKTDIIIGNTLTKSSVRRAINIQADGCRHSVGTGSQCETSKMTGISCPPVTALYYGWKAIQGWQLEQSDLELRNKRPTLLLDGGITKPGDLAKAIACGADAVITGNIFAGCKETPGEIFYKGDVDNGTFECEKVQTDGSYFIFKSQEMRENKRLLGPFKKYRGMASKEVIEEYGIWDGSKENLFVEGKESLVPYNEKSAEEIVYEYVNGLKSCLSYCGFKTLDEFRGSVWTGKTIAVRL